MGANDAQTLKVFQEAEAHNGPSLIIAYSPCINHVFDLNSQLSHQKIAVDSGYWTLLRYNPALAAEGKAPLILDSKKLADDLQKEVDARFAFYDAMSKDTEGLISL
jgi:pyruvate-ferredoxin/flavodoxin oxidoreductase